MFARIFFKRKVHRTVLCIRGWRDTVWWYWNIIKRSLEKAALVREKFPNFCEKTKLPTQFNQWNLIDWTITTIANSFSGSTKCSGRFYAHHQVRRRLSVCFQFPDIFSVSGVLEQMAGISRTFCLQMLTTTYLTWSYESGSNMTVIAITSDGVKICQNTVPLRWWKAVILGKAGLF